MTCCVTKTDGASTTGRTRGPVLRPGVGRAAATPMDQSVWAAATATDATGHRPLRHDRDASAGATPRRRNGSHGLPGHRPISARERAEEPEPLRASLPNGPIRTRRTRRRAPLPSLDESLATSLEFGKFRGHTLGQVAAFEPTYIDWIARTITRDRDLVVKARVIQADLDERGIERRIRPPTPGFGAGRGPDD